MSFDQPTFIEKLLDSVFNNKLGNRLYKSYIKTLGLQGNERILDFGSGSGAASRHIAEILSKDNGRLTCLDMSEAWMGIARKRMEKYANVEFKLGDILTVDIDDAAYDAVFVHFILHDVEKDQRQRIVNALSRKLKAGGRLYIREPIKESHGMPPDEICQLMTHSGLEEVEHKITKAIIPGPMYTGVYAKPCIPTNLKCSQSGNCAAD